MENRPLSKKQYNVLLRDLTGHRFAGLFSESQLRQALETCLSAFADFEMVFTAEFPHMIIRTDQLQTLVDFSHELAPAILYAHRYFGDVLPTDLIAKLRNKTQTLDTIFELKCLGLFQLYHSVSYEPRLPDGKTPDLKITPLGYPPVYVECKSQHMLGTEHYRILKKFTSQIFALVADSDLRKRAWELGLRTEFRLKNTPQPNEIEEIRVRLDSVSVQDLTRGVTFGENIQIVAVPREQPYWETPSIKIAQQTIETTPTKLDHENSYLVAYSWPGIDSKLRRLQRKLLSKARLKLRKIPRDTYGMICMQTYSSDRFLPDVHSALKRQEYERVPIVWINPLQKSRVICRNDALALRDAIFDPLKVVLLA